MSYPEGKPPYVNYHQSTKVPGSGPIVIPGASTISLPLSWDGTYSLGTVNAAYHEASDSIVFSYFLYDGATFWQPKMVAFGPMSSDTPSFGTEYSVPSGSSSTLPIIHYLSTDAKYAFMKQGSPSPDDRILRISISGTTISTTYTSGGGAINTVHSILTTSAGTWASGLDDVGSADPIRFQINTSTLGTPISGRYLNPTTPQQVVSGNDKFINIDATNGLCYITDMSTLTYSTGVSASSNDSLCHDNNLSEVLSFNNQAGTQTIRTYDVSGSTPSQTFTQSLTFSSGLQLQYITYNKYLHRYVYSAADTSTNGMLGIINRKPGGIVLEGTKTGLTTTTGGVYFRNISAGKWIVTFDINNNLNPNTIKFYKIG